MTRRPVARGFALLDALAGFALLSLALLGVLRWQAAAHADARLARDRADAAAAVGSAIERLRGRVAADVPPGRSGFDDVADAEAATDAGLLQTRVAADADGRLKFATVTLRWTDVRGDARAVAVATALDDVRPVHGAALLVPAPPGPVAQVDGRAPVLPPDVRSTGGGRGVWSPAGPGGTVDGAAPVFLVDTVTGEILGRCPPGVASPSPATCPTFRGAWLSGHVRFADDVPPLALGLRLVASPPAAEAACGTVAGPPSADGRDRYVRFTCAVPVPPGRGTWSGRLDVVPSGWPIGTQRGQHRVCRYSADGDGSGAIDRNDEHPAVYADVAGPLAQQNFLVLRGERPCPHNGGSDSTVQHQPPP